MAGRPLGAQNKDKPFRDAIRMEAAALERGEKLEHPEGSLRWNAQQLLIRGDVPAIKEVGDRLDGKPAQALEHGGHDGGPIETSTDPRSLALAVVDLLRQTKD
jgi:hypothetical protein